MPKVSQVRKIHDFLFQILFFRVTCIFENENLIKEPGEHQPHCSTDGVGQRIDELIRDIRRRCQEDVNRPIKRIYDEITQDILGDEELAARFPRYESIESSLYR